MISNRIRQIRKAKGLTQQKLADLVGTSQPQIKRLEKGERGLDLFWMDRLSKALRCSPSDLIDESSGMAEPSSPYQSLKLPVNLTPMDVNLSGLAKDATISILRGKQYTADAYLDTYTIAYNIAVDEHLKGHDPKVGVIVSRWFEEYKDEAGRDEVSDNAPGSRRG